MITFGASSQGSHPSHQKNMCARDSVSHSTAHLQCQDPAAKISGKLCPGNDVDLSGPTMHSSGWLETINVPNFVPGSPLFDTSTCASSITSHALLLQCSLVRKSYRLTISSSLSSSSSKSSKKIPSLIVSKASIKGSKTHHRRRRLFQLGCTVP